ncbi:hypothetical protein KIF24_24720 [Micromonospora sp. Llam7]|uniref:aminoglycoside phosphotransferase family protein n=1 Tax=Micromonospora tarapacensis TaxID=2835305 RepID=UPI001C82A8A7|nr:aminoglycoside phosphotransferase family protein [Micromonospora tarapacensis]MBX7268916.1 hypothetical protein [Micromonospora tarapacensis]
MVSRVSPRLPSKSNPDDAFAALVALAGRAGVGITRVVHRTDKAIVATGTRAGRPVVAKLLISDDPYWVSRRAHELDVYARFASDPPPVRVPELLWADDRLTVLTNVPGRRLHDERHLTRDISHAKVQLVLDTLEALTQWAPDPALPEPIDYHGRIHGEFAAQLLDDAERATLHTLVDRIGPDRVTAHGDALPANLLIDEDRCALVDWEHSGRYLPGHDLALLYTVGAAASPTLATAITDRVAAGGITTEYTMNLVLLVCREIRIHDSLPLGAAPAHRMSTLRDLHIRLRQQLRPASR